MNSIEKIWKNFLEEAVTKGFWVEKDDGDEICEIIDNHCFIPNIVEEVLGNQPCTPSLFLKLVEQGKFNIDGYPIMDTALASYVSSLDDPKQIYLTDEDSFVYTYPRGCSVLSKLRGRVVYWILISWKLLRIGWWSILVVIVQWLLYI